MDSKVFAETNQYDSLSVLWDKMLAINDLRIIASRVVNIRHTVPKLFKSLNDHFEGSAFVVALEILHIFQKKSYGALSSQYPSYIKE